MGNLRVRFDFINRLLMLCVINLLFQPIAISQDVPLFQFKTISLPSKTKTFENKKEVEFKFQCIAKYDGSVVECATISEVKGFAVIEDINTLIPNLPTLDCDAVTLNTSLEDLFKYGSHNEDKLNPDNREFILDGGKYMLNDDPTVSDPLMVEGDSDKTIFKYSFEAPAEAGILETFTILFAPEHPNLNFVFRFDHGFAAEAHKGFHILTIDGLIRMPGCPDGSNTGQNYLLHRGDTDKHPEGHWASQASFSLAIEFADIVAEDYEKTISYNDFSLPMGGFHDLHDTHRNGNDFDINARNRMGYECSPANAAQFRNAYLQHAFAGLNGLDSINDGDSKPYLYCDDEDGHMHVDAAPGI